MVFVYILHYLLYNCIKIEVICLSKKKKKNNTLDDEKIKVEKVKTDNKKDISKTVEIKESTVEKKITSSDNKSKTSKRRSSLFLNLLVALVLLSGGCYFITSLLKFNSNSPFTS